jgi:hypothetical protein
LLSHHDSLHGDVVLSQYDLPVRGQWTFFNNIGRLWKIDCPL